MKCMICGLVAPKTPPGIDVASSAAFIAIRHDWLTIQNADGVFLCCSDCISEACEQHDGHTEHIVKEQYRDRAIKRTA